MEADQLSSNGFSFGDLGEVPGFDTANYQPPAGMSTGDAIADAEIVDDPESPIAPPAVSAPSPTTGRRRRAHSSSADDDSPRDAKSGPPSLDEWQKFFSRVLLRFICDVYLNYAFRGIDEDSLSDRDAQRLAMTDNELKTIAVPFAELSAKSKIMRKYGRTIVSSGDAINAMIVFGAWTARVNRIAAKYRNRTVRGNVNGHSGTGATSATPGSNGSGPVGTHGGRFPNGFSGFVQPGSS